MSQAVGIIGVGEIAGAIVDGLCRDGGDAPAVYLSPRGERTSAALASRYPGVRVCADNQAVADAAPLMILSVRPDTVDEVLGRIRMPRGSTLVSAVAGVSVAVLQEYAGPDVAVVRSIPMPAVRRGSGITAIYPAHPGAGELFERIGGVVETADENAFSALSAATATVSAQLHYLTAVVDWLTRHDIGPAEADRYVRSLFTGAAGELADHDKSLGEHTIAHETPNGLNEQFRRTWFDEAAKAACDDALDGVLRRVTATP